MNYGRAGTKKEINEDNGYKDAIDNVINAYEHAMVSNSANFTNTTTTTNNQLANIMQPVNSLT